MLKVKMGINLLKAGIDMVNKAPKEVWYIMYGYEVKQLIESIRNSRKGLPKNYIKDFERLGLVEEAQH